ncbi:serine/threonine protein kinase [Streptomyces sp. G-G2]|uniref:serine/threonine-protein kinase n=1 Tax=Streptomyces sp. G-G2 TaxID=3046201 RepID=UPI0024BA4357|nr:serine/threonine protein kinase [Streptomyces sp. G-G2]MDJ0382508.1 protein kinase [Streptomyces sp. G-G2]
MEPLAADDPERIGEYRLLRRLGAGGMGRVYLGRTAGGRTVAVKVVHSEFAADAEFRARFRQEVAAARLVGGQWTAPVLDADTESEHPWVATGYVAGPTLGAAVGEFGPLSAQSVRTLGAGLVEALGAVHGLGLVHRDVKPSNVLLALDGPRLIDFGITRALDAATTLTQTGFVVGSPGYMSPEQAQGRPAGPPSDVFSLGAVLAFAATGISPFGDATSAAVLLYRVLHEEPELGGLDGDLRDLVLDCLAKEPGDRPTPAQLRKRLESGGAGTLRLGQGGWLPAAISGSLAQLAVELLDLDTGVGASGVGAPTGAEPRPLSDGSVPSTRWGPAPSEPLPRHQPATQVGASAPPQTPPMPQASPQAQPSTPRTGPSMPPYPQQGPWAQGTPPRRGRNGVMVASVAAVSVAATAALTLWLSHGSQAHEDGNSQGTGAAPAQPSADSNSPGKPQGQTAPKSAQLPVGVPAAFLGIWQGAVGGTTSAVTVTYRIELTQGNTGETIGHSTSTSAVLGVQCAGADILVSASAKSITVTESSVSTDALCSGQPVQVTLRLNTSGSLQATAPGLSGELTKQG